MSLRQIVPTLGALALSTAVSAIEVGDLTIGGFVDTVFTIETSDGSGTPSGDESIMDFSAAAELQFGYNIGDAVSAQVDIEVDGEANPSSSSNVAIEQAYVSWAINDQATLTMGKVETLIAYEAVDAPDLWRVGYSLVGEISPDSTTGLNVGFAPSEQVAVDLYIVDGIYDTDSSPSAGGKLSDDLSFGVSVVFSSETFFVDFDVAVDTGGSSVAEESITVIGVNGEFTGVENLTVFGDLLNKSDDDVDSMALLVGANYQIDDSKSVTGMLSYLEENGDNDDDESMELAIALLTNPTGDANFAVNYELALYMAGDASTVRTGVEDATTISVEFLAVIP